MHRRLSICAIALVSLLVACGPKYLAGLPPTETPFSPSIAATQTPTLKPASTESTFMLGLEIIQAGNWTRLQLLKTFPAEMPLNHSAIAISADGKTMAIGSSSAADILFYDLANGQSRWVFINGVSNVNAYFNTLEYLPDGTLMANSDSPYAIYHIETAGSVLSRWDGIGFALSADKRIMAHHTDEGIALVEIANSTSLLALDDVDAMAFSFSPDGSKIAAEDVGVDYIRTVLWDVPNQTILSTLDETANARFSPNGKFLAVTSYEGNASPLKIFSPDGATQYATLSVSDPNSLNGQPPLWSLDGSIIAAQIGNGSPVAWDTVNWQPLEMPALQGQLYSFSPDGRILITRTDDGAILLWGILP